MLDYWFYFIDYKRIQVGITNRASTLKNIIFKDKVGIDVVFTHRNFLNNVFRFKSYELIKNILPGKFMICYEYNCNICGKVLYRICKSKKGLKLKVETYECEHYTTLILKYNVF